MPGIRLDEITGELGLDTSLFPLLAHVSEAVRTGALRWGESCVVDWLRLLSPDALFRIANLETLAAGRAPSDADELRRDVAGVAVVLRQLEGGIRPDLDVPVELIARDLQVLPLYASLIQLERDGLLRLHTRVRLSDEDDCQIEVWLSERARAQARAGLN